MKKIKYLIIVFILMLAGVNVVNAEDFVAQIGETKYETINEAITNVSESEKIVLLSDLENYEVPKDKVVTIDLGGHKVSELTNNGKLTLVGEGIVYTTPTQDGIINKEGAELIINGITFKGASMSDWVIDNFGDVTVLDVKSVSDKNETELFIKNEISGVVTINKGTFIGDIFLKNFGTATINGGNFETTTSNTNEGTLIVNGGTFKANDDFFFTNARGTITINSGALEGIGVAENYDMDYLWNENKKESIINVNGGTFNVTDTAFNNASLSSYSHININGGTITSTTTDYVLGSYSSKESTIHITGGTINSVDGEGIFIESGTTFIMGENDDSVSKTAPVVTVSKGTIEAFGVPEFKFYDGKIILKEKIDNLFDIIVPEGYYVKYDSNEDGTYTAYLASTGNEAEEDKSEKEETKEENKEENKPEKEEAKDNNVKNPDTGINLGYGILGLIVIIGSVIYIVIRKKSNFLRHN